MIRILHKLREIVSARVCLRRNFADRYRRFNKTGQTLSYTEVRQGLASLAPPVHMTNQEFMDVMHVVDPDQSGDLSAAEWEAFLTVRTPSTLGVCAPLSCVLGPRALL